MMRWIIDSSLKLRFLVLVLAAVMLVFGIAQLRQMPLDVFPEFNPPLVEVHTEALGLSATEVESLLTVPLEADLLNGVAWLDQIYSESVVGLSSILLVFEPGTDPIRARQMVQERLTQTFALPNVSKPPTMLQPLSTTSRVMMVGLSSDEVPLIDLGVLARWNIKPRLMGVTGVANVAIWGQREWQLQVLVDPEVMQERGVTLQQVIETTGEALWVSPLSFLESSSPGTAGWIDTPNQRLSLQHELPISSAEDLARIPVKGSAWRLGEVSRVVEDRQPLIGDAVLRDGEGLLLVIEKFPNANTLEVTRDVEAALQAMQPGLTGIDIDTTVFRPANYIEAAVDNLGRLFIIGAILAILVFAAYTYSWQGVVINVIAVAASLMTAVLVLYLRGASFNFVILAGLIIAFGVIVDDAVTTVAQIRRRLREAGEGAAEYGPAATITNAILETREPLAFATLIILLAILPVFFLEGLTGTFFRPLALTFVLAVLASLVVALVITSTLAYLLLPGAPDRPSPFVAWLQRLYGQLLKRSLPSPTPALATFAVLLLLSVLTLPFLEVSWLPPLQQTDLFIQWEAAPGTSRVEMNRITGQVSRELQSIAGIRNVGTHLGRAITGDQVVGIHSGEIWISLDPDADYDNTIAAIQNVIAGYPGLLRSVQQYLPERIDEVLGTPEQDIVVRIYGHEFDVLDRMAQQVVQVLTAVDGTENVLIDSVPQRPHVEIEVDLAAAERYQVKPGDVRRASATLLSGLQVGNLYEGQKVFDVVVWGVPEIRDSVSDVGHLLVDTPRGGHVRLNDVADVRIGPTPLVIRRDAVSRYIDVGANVSGRSFTAVAADVRDNLQAVTFPIEYHAELRNQSVQQQTELQRLLLVALIALLGAFLLLQAAFDSWRLAALTMVTLPVALSGGVLAMGLAGGKVSFGSVFGLLTVLAVTLRHAVMLLRHIQSHGRETAKPFDPSVVIRAAQERLPAITMAVLATGLALLPLILAGGISGNEVVQPIAIVVVSGLLTATAANLFILPALYLHFGASPIRDAPAVAVGRQAGSTVATD